MNGPAHLPDDAFKEAYEEFSQLLPPNEKLCLKDCHSASELIDAVAAFSIIKRDQIRGRGLLARIRSFGDMLQPYILVIDTLVSSHAEYTALIWGSLKAVLMLASNIPSFFDKLTRAIERLAKAMPHYSLITQFYHAHPDACFSDRIRQSVKNVYVDIFQFLQSVCRVFIKKDGSERSKAHTFSKLLWRPYDSRFQDHLTQLEYHRQVVMDEIRMAEMFAGASERDRAGEERSKAENERLRIADAQREILRNQRLLEEARFHQDEANRDDLIESLRRWLRPGKFTRLFERACESREKETCLWLFQNALYQHWENSGQLISQYDASSPRVDRTFGENVLWVQGNPGCGKTVLAAATVEHLQTGSTDETGISASNVFYFFFSAASDGQQSTSAAHRSLLAQILQARRHDQDFIDAFQFAMGPASSGQATISDQEAAGLLLLCAQKLEGCVFVVDGVDECCDCERLVESLLDLCWTTSNQLILFSRPSGNVLQPVIKASSNLKPLEIGRSTTGDISKFIRRRLNDFFADDLLKAEDDEEELFSRLLNGADGMFLWAVLMINYLASPAFSPNQRKKQIMSIVLPERLDEMYDRIIRLVLSGRAPERQLARDVFVWLVYAARQLTLSELQDAIVSETLPESHNDRRSDSDFRNAILSACACLIEVDGKHKHASVRFIHVSAREYLVGAAPCDGNHATPSHESGRLELCPLECHSKLARACLLFVKFHLPAQQITGDGGLIQAEPAIEAQISSPFFQYASGSWIDHLHDAVTSAQGGRAVSLHRSKELESVIQCLHSFLKKWICGNVLDRSYVRLALSDPPDAKQLARWAKFASSSADLLLGDEHRQSLKVTQDFSHYLIRLANLWGDNLLKNPHCIWEEVTAFTPHNLLPRNMGFIVRTVRDESDDSSHQTPLREVVELGAFEDNQSALGTVTIYPSKLFRANSKITPETLAVDDLHLVSTGWSATYTIRTLDSPPQTIMAFRLDLSPEEVWLQVSRSICLRDIWEVQFPVSICPNLRSFTIMRTLYSLSPADSGKEIQIEASLISLELDPSFKKLWDRESQVYKRNWDTCIRRDTPRDIYAYWMAFSPDGRYLVFVDQYEALNNLLVFRLHDGDKAVLNLVARNKTMGLCGFGCFDMFREIFETPQVRFHPDRLILAFIGQFSVRIWATDTNALKWMKGIRDLQFTRCGQMIVTSLDSVWPIQQTLPEEILRMPAKGEMEPKSAQPQTVVFSAAAIATVPSQSVSMNLALRVCGPPTNRRKLRSSMTKTAQSSTQIASQKTYKAAEDGQIATWTSLQGGNVTISQQLVRKDVVKQNSLEILRLPKHSALQEFTATTVLPASKADPITIVLKGGNKPWCNLDEGQLPPSVVYRDQRTLGPLLATGLERMREIDSTGSFKELTEQGELVVGGTKAVASAKHKMLKIQPEREVTDGDISQQRRKRQRLANSGSSESAMGQLKFAGGGIP